MKARTIFWLLILIPFISASQISFNDEFCLRRTKIISSLDSLSAIVMRSINQPPLVNEYVQEHNFNYLTGINSPMCYLLMTSRGIKVGNQLRKVIMFCAEKDIVDKIAICETDTILPAVEFRNIFNKLLPQLSKLYYSAPDLILVNDWINDKPYFAEREMKNKIRALYPNLKIESAEYFVGKFRAIKSPHEISLIRKASDITADGITSAMKIAKPGIFEYELQAAVEYEYTRQGALLRGFPSIIGSGLNNLILHYSDNTRQTKSGDLVVMDVGAKYKGYSSDITRTIPINGKFTDAQKEIYGMVLQVQKEAIAMLKPGIKMQDLENFARNAFKKLGYEKYYTHGLSHPVGLDVHDINTESILKTGMVITIEPGLYFPPDDLNVPEKYRGFGVRIEDTVLITETGFEIITSKAPKEIADIEKIMKKGKRD